MFSFLIYLLSSMIHVFLFLCFYLSIPLLHFLIHNTSHRRTRNTSLFKGPYRQPIPQLFTGVVLVLDYWGASSAWSRIKLDKRRSPSVADRFAVASNLQVSPSSTPSSINRKPIIGTPKCCPRAGWGRGGLITAWLFVSANPSARPTTNLLLSLLQNKSASEIGTSCHYAIHIPVRMETSRLVTMQTLTYQSPPCCTTLVVTEHCFSVHQCQGIFSSLGLLVSWTHERNKVWVNILRIWVVRTSIRRINSSTNRKKKFDLPGYLYRYRGRVLQWKRQCSRSNHRSHIIRILILQLEWHHLGSFAYQGQTISVRGVKPSLLIPLEY
jgi:hypothetical protein